MLQSFKKKLLCQKNHSLWEQIPAVKLPRLEQSIVAEIGIVGGGIAGLSVAYRLLKSGHQVVVLERDSQLGGETRLTSAHLSNALDDHYFRMEKDLGLAATKLAAQSHSLAINQIKQIIDEEKIDCDFSWLNGYLIPGGEDTAEVLAKELWAARRAGLKVRVVEQIKQLKRPQAPALKFPDQARFYALKYLRGLQEAIISLGGKILQAEVIDAQETPEAITVKIKDGPQLTCQQLVVATNVPILNRVQTHTKEAAYRSYVIGIKIPKGSFPKILLWDTAVPYHYLRLYEEADYDVLLVGGEDHRVGQLDSETEPFQNLRLWVDNRLGLAGEIIYQWSGQIIETLDGLAYIGRSPGTKHIYEISGDSGHGITHGTLASLIIPELMKGLENDLTKLYDPGRIKLGVNSMANLVVENLQGFAQTYDWITPGEISHPEQLDNGQGAILRKGLNKLAVYKDFNGNLHECSAECPHLGALVRWNAEERTWDCPFHGSRFAPTGEVLNGPTKIGLKKIDKPNSNGSKT